MPRRDLVDLVLDRTGVGVDIDRDHFQGLHFQGLHFQGAPLAIMPKNNDRPRNSTPLAASTSRPRPASSARDVFLPSNLCIAPLASTALAARAPVVRAVPAAIASVAQTPILKAPCAKAKTSTNIAPEQGR